MSPQPLRTLKRETKIDFIVQQFNSKKDTQQDFLRADSTFFTAKEWLLINNIF